MNFGGQLILLASLAENGKDAIGKLKELWYAGLTLKQTRLSDV